MKNAESRLARLERRTTSNGGAALWKWAESDAFRDLPEMDQQRVVSIMEKMRPYLPDDLEASLDQLTDEELDLLEAFYIASTQSLGGDIG